MNGKSNYQIYSTSKEAWDAMYQAIFDAQKSIYWEVYILVDDSVGNRFFDLLCEKVKQGVDVKIVVDYWGSFWLSNKAIEKLKNAGVDIRLFKFDGNIFHGLKNWLARRNHRKIMVIDETVGFIGGVNVQKEMENWLDIHVSVEGNAVNSLSRAFAKSYIISGGDKEKVKKLLQYKFRIKKDEAEFIYDEPNQKISNARKKYTEALLKARERVILFSPYYFPDRKFLQALWAARKRGVRVDLLIPFRVDIKIAKYAAFAWFSIMRKHGVNIHLIDKMMHGKGVIVDDDWAMVGSTNIEQSAFYNNYEANVKIQDKLTVKKLKDKVLQWLEQTVLFDDIKWAKRSRWYKFKEKFALRVYKYWYRRKK
ncbi:MAG: phosphatidylserine/phosphatidylglycerophosphate/cardiolipin synthase family protein [Candidatus Magasanikiibacteriota bacterium]